MQQPNGSGKFDFTGLEVEHFAAYAAQAGSLSHRAIPVQSTTSSKLHSSRLVRR
jgi:hypothetical protein